MVSNNKYIKQERDKKRNTLCPSTLPRSLIAADKVPPVAIKSSIIKARSPAWTAPTCISIMSVPYSKEYSSEITSPDKTIKEKINLNLISKGLEDVWWGQCSQKREKMEGKQRLKF